MASIDNPAASSEHRTVVRGLLATTIALALAATAAFVVPVAARPSTARSAAEPANETAEAVIAAALVYVGLPYRLGAEGPDLFDCSGLVFRAFADGGQLSRIGGSRLRAAGYLRWFTARGLFTAELDYATRGDLVIYGGGSHIGIYLGEGRVVSAVRSGVAVHRLDGLTVPLTGYLRVDWTGPATGGKSGRPLPPSNAEEVPEQPVDLVPPLAWLPPTAGEATDPADPVGLPAPPGEERIDLRTANSRSYEAADGTLVTEFFSRPIFYRPDDAELLDDAEWQPIDLRFEPVERGRAAGSMDSGPVSLLLFGAGRRAGFVELSAGDVSIALGLPRAAAAGRPGVLPAIGTDGGYADYVGALSNSVGMRVFPRSDGVKVFLVLHQRPLQASFSFTLSAPDLALAADDGHGATLSDADGRVVARIPRPLALDSSDVDGSGGAASTDAASLALGERGGRPRITLTVDGDYLAQAVYPVYLVLTVAGLSGQAAAATFASSGQPDGNFAYYQRPELGGRDEVWLGRQPGTSSYNEVYLGFAGLAELVAGAEIHAASLQLRPYWLHDGRSRATSVLRVAEPWRADTLSWSSRPATDLELGTFRSTPGTWSELDLTDHVEQVASGALVDHGLMLHANDFGRRGWKRIIASGDAPADEGPRLIVHWSPAPEALGRPSLTGASSEPMP